MFNSQWFCVELCLIVFHVRSVKGLMQLDTCRRLSPSLATRSLVQSVNLEKERIQASWKLYCQYLSVINCYRLSKEALETGVAVAAHPARIPEQGAGTTSWFWWDARPLCPDRVPKKWTRDSIITLTAALLFCWNSAQQQFWWPNTTAIATVMLWTRHVNVVKPFRAKMWRLR